jgi:chromosome segregation ATPase
VPPSRQNLQAAAADVLITPRVLDQAAFDSLSESLRSLIRDAIASGSELRGALDELTGARDEATKSSRFLQDRLKVSVRMLKAFQSQIEQIQSQIETLDNDRRSGQQLLAEIEQRVDSVRDRTEALTQLVESAEVNIAVLAHRSAQAATKAELTAAELAGRLARWEACDQEADPHLPGAASPGARSEET